MWWESKKYKKEENKNWAISTDNNTSRSSSNSPSTTDDLEVYGLLDAELRPLTPDSTSKISQDIFNEHKQLAQKYLKVQTEIALLGQQKTESLKNLSADTLKLLKEIEKFEDEKVERIKLKFLTLIPNFGFLFVFCLVGVFGEIVS